MKLNPPYSCADSKKNLRKISVHLTHVFSLFYRPPGRDEKSCSFSIQEISHKRPFLPFNGLGIRLPITSSCCFWKWLILTILPPMTRWSITSSFKSFVKLKILRSVCFVNKTHYANLPIMLKVNWTQFFVCMSVYNMTTSRAKLTLSTR